jgi:ribosome-binding factor A
VNERMRRVNEALHQVVAEGVEELGDPSLGIVTVTAVRATPDLRLADVYVSVLGSARRRERSLAALQRAHGVLQRQVSQELRLKRTPQLTFHYDQTLDTALRLHDLLNESATPAAGPSPPLEREPDD